MSDQANSKDPAPGVSRRATLLAGAGLAAAAGAMGEAQAQADLAKDTSVMYPPVKPGIEPRGAKVKPYTAAD